jgi:hypothetical protein
MTGILTPLTPEEEVQLALRQEAGRLEEAEELGRFLYESDVAAERQRQLDGIDKALGESLRPELEQENKTARVTAQNKKDFELFKKSAVEWGLPSLPASPQMVAAFLTEQFIAGETAILPRLRNSISIVHRACNFPDPTEDVLVRALVRGLRPRKEKAEKET